MSVLGIISTVSGKLSNAIGDRDGRLHVVSGGTPVIYSTTTAIALSLSTSIGTQYRRPARLKRIVVTFSTAPTTADSLTVTVYPYGSGSRPNALVLSLTPSATSATSVVNTWDSGYDLALGDEVVMAFTNTDTRTIKAEIEIEIL
jgi:hypothetical protein